jgi:hypothetical protein
MNKGASVIVLNESADIYMVVDERGRTIGTGTREVCEILARITMKPTVPSNRSVQISPPAHDNVRSAIKF